MIPRRRLTATACLCLLPVIPLSLQLIRLGVWESARLRGLALSELKRLKLLVSPRAEILDRKGRVLARSLPAWACFVDSRMVDHPRSLLRSLSALPDLNLKGSEGALRSCLASGAPICPAAEGLSYEAVTRLKAEKIPALGFLPRALRLYPNGTLGRGVIGEVSRDGRGLSGVELAEDSSLKNRSDKIEVLRDGSGRFIYRRAQSDELSKPSRPVELTLDSGVQYYARQALEEAVRLYRPESALIAVQDPRTGEILASAAWPENPLKDPLVEAAYEPGSVFKIVAALGILEESGMPPEEKVFCENGKFSLAPRVVIHDHEPSAYLDLAGIIERSSNIGISKVALRMGAMSFYRWARMLGFSSKTGIPLPAESEGLIPPLKDLTPVRLASASFGYGVRATPIQILNAYSAIANGGRLWQPKIVKDGSPPALVRSLPHPEAVRRVARMLEGVVLSGTGAMAAIDGYRVAGKTGTSRMYSREEGGYDPSAYNASFVGFLPVSDPRWTIMVRISRPKSSYYASETAAPTFKRLASKLLAMEGVPPDKAGKDASLAWLGH